MLPHLVKALINLHHDTIPKGQTFNRLSNDLFKIDIGESFMFYNVSSYCADLFIRPNNSLRYISTFLFSFSSF